MGFWSELLGGGSLEALLRRARHQLAAGDFDDALETVARGLARYPDAASLRETGHATRRAQARAGMSALQERIDREEDPAAYEQLIALYHEVGMPAEASRLMEEFADAHPALESPHLLRGERAVDAFFQDLRARDGRCAIDSLLRAGAIQPDSLRPRMLLAEVFYAIGADRALAGQAAAIARLSGDDEVVAPALGAMRAVARPEGPESVDACLAAVEVAGALVRDPSPWSGRTRRGIASSRDSKRLTRELSRLVAEGDAVEAVAIDRSGTLVASGSPTGDAAAVQAGPESPLAGVARTVARTIKVQARELELGSFRRCVVEGPFGVMVVGDAAGGVVAARGRKGADPGRLWERLSVARDGVRGKKAT